MLREVNDQDVRVFVIWEPVLPTDFVAPSTAARAQLSDKGRGACCSGGEQKRQALARIPDGRVSQYWDRKRSLSHFLGEHNRSTVVWDHIAVYAPGTLWQDAPPEPVYSDNPVRDVISGAKDAIQRLLAIASKPAGGQK